MIDLEKRPRPEHLQENLAVTNYVKTQGLRLARRLATSLEDKKTGGDAQFLLGSSYGSGGLGLVESEEQAFHWYLQASKLAHPEATYRAGVCYELGLGTRKDLQRALVFFRRAAQNSHVLSMYKLGIILVRGLYHQPKLLRDGVGWLQRAVMTSGNQVPEPLHALAICQLTPDVNERCHTDPQYAIQLLHDAARLDYVPSLLQLAACYERGHAVDADDALSIYWYSRAASLRSSEGALGLAAWYLTGARRVLEASTDLAFQWARKAVHFARKIYVEKGIGRWELAKACFFVGFLIEQGVAPLPPSTRDNDPHCTAMYWFRLAADLGHMTAAQRISAMTAEKTGVAPVPSPSPEPRLDKKKKKDEKKRKKEESKPEV
ncbi:hypothetical protein BCR43DRAFT_443187 [Syncephalastrum racemosum]|uniref:HCP-like protein n=1 Tax=Syncephalastrum racemosum TaxID=13706 RepID=A0A1X2H5S3_SYNRA|nr:hypothetical protein BCR43DRAFT_443187 [Syncephalastrum racemosum]